MTSTMPKALLLTALLSLAASATNAGTTSAPRTFFPEQLTWQPNAALPGAFTAVIVGEPAVFGPFTTRTRLPAGVIFKPHYHPEDRVYTVISGIFYIGFGELYDRRQLRAYPPGSVITVPGGSAHFHAAVRGDWVVQINAVGPTSVTYVNAADDPRL